MQFFSVFQYLFFLSFGVATIATNTITSDQYALLAFKDHVNSSILAENWSITHPVCEWMGVTCGSLHQRVTALNLSDMNLSSTIPPQLGNLSFLSYIDFRRNNFHGELPIELSRLRRLRVLSLGSNNLEGEIPSWIGSFHQLRIIDLYNNSVSGNIPSSISSLSNLRDIRLSFNTLNGSIPRDIGNLQVLKKLIIEHNQISGHIPPGLFNISSLEVIALNENNLVGELPMSICSGPYNKFTYLDLDSNRLDGQLPSGLAQCSDLQVLSLSDNQFDGSVPKEIGSLKVLNRLNLHNNNLEGNIPREIGNLTMLKELTMANNRLSGRLPKELTNLYKLEDINLVNNSLSGYIPVEIFNISTLNQLGLGFNTFLGKLPSNMCQGLPNLKYLFISDNNLDGTLPESISNCSNLVYLEVSNNNFVGFIPNSLGNLRLLEFLNLGHNNFSSDASSLELAIVTSLANCKSLRVLSLNYNPLLNVQIPESVGNLSSLEIFNGVNCGFKGKIPLGFGNLGHLIWLTLPMNQLIGSIPKSIGKLYALQILVLEENKLSGAVPEVLCGNRNLVTLRLGENQISGSIPGCLGNITSLRKLGLESNRLGSSIPSTLFSLKDLLYLNLSSNYLVGSLPSELGNLKVLVELDLAMNNLSGIIPSTIGSLQGLSYISLGKNSFEGLIPESVSNIISLETLELSQNNFFGLIPLSFEKIRYLKYFNVSFNHLSGRIPSAGPFQNFTYRSFMSNDALCGPQKFHVPSCPKQPGNRSRNPQSLRMIFICVGVIAAIFGFLALVMLFLRYRRKMTGSSEVSLPQLGEQERISYYDLQQATNGYNEESLLGSGLFGSVYLGTLKDGRIVAIKVFNSDSEKAFKSFVVECQVLRNLRHRNLNKVISSCSAPDFKALVLEFMPNGSLEKCLYSGNVTLSMKQRLNIMIDVATGLLYLHCGYSTPVVHCDIKPSNVLLDEEMMACVGDFGITKMLSQEDSCTHTGTIATFAYVAPEYGSEGLVSTSCDVYSFGIMLMEVFTVLRPTDEKFHEDLTLKDMVLNAMPDRIVQIADASLFQDGEEHNNSKRLECLTSIMEIALCCSRESPSERSAMNQVVTGLTRVKTELMKIQP